MIVDNTLDRQFDVDAPDPILQLDITYIRTLEGFAYLAVVIDLYSRRVVRLSLRSRQTADVVLQALLMAVWRRKPKGKVLIHSDQGSQFTNMDWASFLKAHNLEHSMSRRGNCHDNAVAESFFNLLKAREDTTSDLQNPRLTDGMCSTTSRCSTIRNANMRGTDAVTRKVRTADENEYRVVFRKLGAIQVPCKPFQLPLTIPHKQVVSITSNVAEYEPYTSAGADAL